MKRIVLLFNEDDGLVRGEAQDAIAARGVLEDVSQVEAACRELGFETCLIPTPQDPRGILERLDAERPDLVFHLCEAVGGDARFEAAVAWLLEMARIPYTGSGPLALSIALDKWISKSILLAHGVSVPAGRVLSTGGESLAGLRYPAIVKPSREDASHGLALESVVSDEDSARRRARYVIERYAQPALVEEFIDGREFNVSILGTGENAAPLSLGEIDFSNFPEGAPKFVTYQAKWVEESPEYTGSASVAARKLNPATRKRIFDIALAAYRAVGVRDYGRIDIRFHPEIGPVVLEVNPNPCIAPDAGLALAARRSGIQYRDLIARILEGAFSRAEPVPSAA